MLFKHVFWVVSSLPFVQLPLGDRVKLAVVPFKSSELGGCAINGAIDLVGNHKEDDGSGPQKIDEWLN